MEIRLLKTFCIAAERGNFTRAAEELGLTQAAVSQQVSLLEKQFPVRLFQRRGRGVRLTRQGQQLYQFAQQILDLVAKATAALKEVESPLSGEFRIAASTVPAEWFLPEMLADFRTRWPDVRESLTVTDSRLAADMVEAGEADLGFVGELPHSSNFSAKAISEDELVLFVATGHALAEKGSMTLNQLRGETLILRELGSGSRHCLELALEGQGLSLNEFNIAMEVNSNESIRAAVERGVGVAFLSKRIGRHEYGLVPIKVRGLRARRKLYVISDVRRELSAPAKEFLAFAEQWQSDKVS